MQFFFYSPVHFEQWDWRNSIEKGIGGSETSHVEMAWRLARRGHKVTSYAPIPDDCPGVWMDTNWIDYEKADFTQPGIWVLYRCPDALDNFAKEHPNQQLWLMMQDESYPSWTEERASKVDRVLALCQAHARATEKRFPYLKGKVFITSNGVKMELLRDVLRENITRNPYKLIYASSPDRGLEALLTIFKRAREFVPELELHVFYGFDNIDKLIKYNKRFKYFKDTKKKLTELLVSEGVTYHGRVSQNELYKQWLSAGLWVYPTNFTETSCITSMEAQALGAIPITNPLWALLDNVKSGVFIQGDPYNDPLTQARFVGEIIRLTSDQALQEEIRPDMMKNAQNFFNWERWVDQWESWIFPNFEAGGMYIAQFNFQLKYAKGNILNIGCDVDPANFHNLGATNLDVVAESPILKVPTKADVIADARNLPDTLFGQYNSVILGDILEHMQDADIIKTLQNAKKCLVQDGHIVITCPDDHRPVAAQHTEQGNKGYAEGVSSYHERPISREHLTKLIIEAGLHVYHYQTIDYTMFYGTGFIAA